MEAVACQCACGWVSGRLELSKPLSSMFKSIAAVSDRSKSKGVNNFIVTSDGVFGEEC